MFEAIGQDRTGQRDLFHTIGGNKADSSPEPRKVLSNRQSYVEIRLPSNYVKFNLAKDQFKFSTIGLYGTNEESSFYKVIATVCGH